jgi:2-polyprenyl-3-methyl-5-hydroxy-6-metoxy-1,4-benzoquinol methylase
MQQLSENKQRCPACRSEDPQPIWSQGEPADFRVRRCGACQLTYTVPELTPDELLAYYGEPYYGKTNVRFNRLFESLVMWFRNRRARKIRQYMKTGRALDVGCGRGHVLARLRAQGWEVQGVELNEVAVRHARDELGLNVQIGAFDPTSFPRNHLDVIVFWHVLEHLAEPMRAINGSWDILKPGGLLVIAVPNIASWQARLSKYHWFHLDLPRHITHFSESWLCKRLASAGFSIKEVSHFSFEQNPYGWIQSVLNRCGLRRNLLYDIFKNESARSLSMPFRRFPVQSALSLLGFAILLPMACFMLIPEAVFRRGPTIELYAIKTGRQSGAALPT